MTHELGDLFREHSYLNHWLAVCSCGWESSPHRQRRFSMREFSDHVAEMEETRLVNP